MESLQIQPVSFLKLLGKNIKRERLKKGWSMETLGLEVGSSRHDVGRMEKGRNITMITFRKISLALDVPTCQLMIDDCTLQREVELEMLVDASKANRVKKIIA